ncbi:MAG TPA: 4Fe-4S binding protein [Syntrophomonadaceae bacterium]|nr:4Fe-4S binding protein [Syntrophomonadaceae bacterium]
MAHVITELCLGCGVCVDECPTEAIKEDHEKYSIDPELCTDCGTCAESCPADAIEGPSEE